MNSVTANAGSEQNAQPPVKLLKRIGSATIEVVVHFSNEGSETMADIVRRLIEREASKIV